MISHALNIGRRWGTKVSLSIVDQGLISGANFALNIFLARWLSPFDYGLFAIVYAIFLFLSVFHIALIQEPMSVIGSSQYGDQISQYLYATLWIHLILMIGTAFLLSPILVALAISENALFPPLLGLFLSSPFIFLFFLLRRACYVITKPELASKVSLLYVVFLFIAIFLMEFFDCLSSFNAFLSMGMASGLVSLIAWRSILVNCKNQSLPSSKFPLQEIWRSHWGYGKWIVGAGMCHWVSQAAYTPLIGGIIGISQAGAFRAIQNLFLPVHQILSSLGLLFLPWLSKQSTFNGPKSIEKQSQKLTFLNISIVLGFFCILTLFGSKGIVVLYGQPYYLDFIWLVPYLGVLAFLAALIQSWGTNLRALKQSNTIFMSKLVRGLFVVVFGIFLIFGWGLTGVLVGMILAGLMEAIILFYYRYKIKVFEGPL